MKMKFCSILCLFFCGMMFTACGGGGKKTNINPSVDFDQHKLSAEKYVQMVDTFVVILDASGSMDDKYIDGSKERKIDTARKFLNSMVNTLPDLEFTAGLRVFGMAKRSHSDNTPILYWLTESTRDGFISALSEVRVGQNAYSSLPLSINRTADILLTVDSRPELNEKTLSHVGVDATDKSFKAPRGKIAVIVVSDGSDNPGASLLACKDLKKRFPDRLNLYTVSVGSDPEESQGLKRLANVGGGFSVVSNEVTSAVNMRMYLEKILIAPDEDNDDVADSNDQCPNTPPGAVANIDGCTPDTDDDGTYDYLDRCPRTPAGLAVNNMGCPADTDADGKYDDHDQSPATPEWINDLKWGSVSPSVRHLRFGVSAYELSPWMYSILDEYVAFLKLHPEMTLSVRGYSDNLGTKAQNMNLSKKRANAARAYLLTAKVNPSQLKVSYHGADMPMADTTTIEGRNLNRRVELEIVK